MDPLSVAAGVLGIITFAHQLAKTASKANRAIQEVKSAPKEVMVLIERLSMLESACQIVSSHLERRKTLPNYSMPTIPDTISKTLASCLARVQDLELELSNLNSKGKVAGAQRSKSDAFSGLRLVFRKDKINSLVQELDRTASLLQFVIQIDIWNMTSNVLQSGSFSIKSIELMNALPRPDEISGNTPETPPYSQPIVARSAWRVTNRPAHASRYLCYFTWTIDCDTNISESGAVNRRPMKKGCITFRLPLTATQLSLHYDHSMGSPSYALNVTHVIGLHSELGVRVHRLMRLGGDAAELNDLVANRELSVYSVLRQQGWEINLFFFAVAVNWAEGCRYLLDHDCRRKFVEDDTPLFLFGTLRHIPRQNCEATDIFLRTRSHDSRERDIRFLLETRHDPEYFSRYLRVLLNTSEIDHAAMLNFAWKHVVWNVSLHGAVSSWIPAIHYLIEQGVDIHQRFYEYCSSAYTKILSMETHPFDADEKAHTWLEMLKACGVDLRGYTDAEAALVEQIGFGRFPCARRRKTVMLDFHGLPMPSWRWEIPTESKVVEVLEEFANLGPDNIGHRLPGLHPAGPNDLNFWRAGKSYDEKYDTWGKDCFPFLFSPIDSIYAEDDNRLDRPWCRETYHRAVEVRDKRLARRQLKKWRKAHPGTKLPSSKMPGSWVD